MLAAIKAAEDAVAAVPGEPAMLDALSVVMNMSALALERDCLYNDPRILSYRQRALDVAQQIYDLQPRNREAKGVVAHMYSALAQTLVSSTELDNRVPQARQAFLNAYRLRVELADTDPSNQFYAAQVMKSRLDLQELRTHDSDPLPKTFTEREALANLGTAQGRRRAKEAGVEAVWLLVFAEHASLRENDRIAATDHTRALLDGFGSMSLNEADVYITLKAETLLHSLTKSTKEELLPSRSLDLSESLDCRSRYTRRLAFALLGDDAASQAEKRALDDRNATFTSMDFYERLIAEMNGS